MSWVEFIVRSDSFVNFSFLHLYHKIYLKLTFYLNNEIHLYTKSLTLINNESHGLILLHKELKITLRKCFRVYLNFP